MSKQSNGSFKSDSWEERAVEINKDIKTDAIRNEIQINLTDKELNNLKLLAYRAGFDNAGELLSSFTGDLTGWHSNGSDERELASQWYERAFGIRLDYFYFTYYLFNNDFSFEEINEMFKNQESFEDVYKEYVKDSKTRQSQSEEECIQILSKIIKKGSEL